MAAAKQMGFRKTKMKIVLTGSSSGIGQFLADTLAGKGHQVCRLARSPQGGFSFQCDVSDWSVVQTCAGKISDHWDSLDALICCAGIQEPIGRAMEIDPLLWRKNLAVNLDGTNEFASALTPTPDILQNAPADGTTGDDHLGISTRRRIVENRDGGIF